ncbi:helix-turn-helix transcriptional regulator [uncultured Aurantimicrobium sp.]|uniref:helix-turn-helix transcriptional regulator n=1 Tax=uncultured Aurantimicrobium sp. TaxID=1705357 RepID=UPI002631C6D6|nr:helix-turn-helix transcriptional regulator [uncultured Aurantimicrobium sp.]
MSANDEVSSFLKAMRERIPPEFAGFPAAEGDRRVPGLRREEVATRAGISLSYYTRLERGNFTGASESVVNSLARALDLSETERIHLFDLVTLTGSFTPNSQFQPQLDFKRYSNLLDGMTAIPAMLVDRVGNPLLSNEMCRRLYPDLFPEEREPLNLGRYIFLDPRSKIFYPEWDEIARDAANNYRFLSGKYPNDPELAALISELRSGSREFEAWWTLHDVRMPAHGTKEVIHPAVGRMTINYEILNVNDDIKGLVLMSYFPQPNSSTVDAMQILIHAEDLNKATPPSNDSLRT